jgi:hypothetical protein
MTLKIRLDNQTIDNLDLSPVTTEIEKIIAEGKIALYEQKIQFEIEYTCEANDPRELPEIPEIRLWFLRLDSKYPWFPFLLDWEKGELVRYAAMLVPHQFSRSQGIQYNLEALEIFVMHKIFVLHDCFQNWQIQGQFRLKSMAQMFGYDVAIEEIFP